MMTQEVLPTPERGTTGTRGLAMCRQPLSFGPGSRWTLQGRVGLAPLAGVSEQIFRELAYAHGAAITTTELVSARGIRYSGLEPSRRYLALSPKEGPVLLQLFGSDPEDFAYAIPQILEDAAFQDPALPLIGFDLNMGCPVDKVVKTGAGSALMRDAARAGAIIEAMRTALDQAGRADLAVTAKIRLGYESDDLQAPDVARTLVGAGVDLLAVHGRTRAQMYRGHANLEGIATTVQAVRNISKIPVLGNGDITSGYDAVHMMTVTGCDGVLIGRAAEGRPWVFALNGVEPPVPERVAIARQHAQGLVRTLGASVAMREFRKTLMKYLSGTRGAADLRRQAAQVTTLEELEDVFVQWMRGAEG